MTDRTHPDSGRIITSGDVIAELHDRIAELEAELEAVGAGGVQALAASAPVAPAPQIEWDEVFDCAVYSWCRSSKSQEMLRMCFQSRNQQDQVSVGWTANDLMSFAKGIAGIVTAAPPAPSAQDAEDTALLDWLSRVGTTTICLVMDRPHDGEIEVSTDDGPTGYGKTLRDAIRAARAQQKGGA